jgi:hypothetical protein
MRATFYITPSAGRGRREIGRPRHPAEKYMVTREVSRANYEAALGERGGAAV